MPEAPTSVIDNTQLTALLNEGQIDVARRTECLESYTDSDVVAATQEYSIPSKAIRIQGVYYGGSDNWEKLPMVTMEFLANDIDPAWFDLTGTISGYYLRADKVGLFRIPTASEAGTSYLRIYTIDKPTDMANDSDEVYDGVDKLVSYGELPVYYAMYHAKMIVGKYNQADLLEARYLLKVAEMKKEMNRMDDFQQPITPYYKNVVGWSGKQNPLSQ